MERTTQGTLSALGACLLWGILPIYWKALKHLPAVQILAHRVIWSFLFLLLLLVLQKRWKEVRCVLSSRGNLRTFLVTSFLLGANWLTYIWAVNTNQIVEVSLGYFINPLVNVGLGVLVLRERLYRWQVLSVGLAFIGVLFLALRFGRVPWVALALAGTFGLYGLLRKTARAESMVGLSLEMVILAPMAAVYLVTLGVGGFGALGLADLWTPALLGGSGVVTAIPLLLFTHGARRIPYSTVGLLQYVSPTGHLMVGILLYRESFTAAHAIAFGCVWGAIGIYSLSTLTIYRTLKV